nr:RsfS/YbeB/iojap family protein [Bacteroidetes bacterium endosymbiont of Geopemphigus sp.]
MPEIFMLLEVIISTLLETIIKGIRQIKGEDSTILDLTQIENIIFGYSSVYSGSSSTQISAIAASLEEQVFRNTRELMDLPMCIGC